MNILQDPTPSKCNDRAVVTERLNANYFEAYGLKFYIFLKSFFGKKSLTKLLFKFVQANPLRYSGETRAFVCLNFTSNLPNNRLRIRPLS